MRLRRLERAYWDVVAVCSDRGACPTSDFLERLEGKLAKQGVKAWAMLRRAAQRGPHLGGELSKELGDGIFEFRPGDLRILWFHDAGRLIVCTQGFVKRSQKTPAVEIERAREVRRRYFEAKRHGALEIEEVDG